LALKADGRADEGDRVLKTWLDRHSANEMSHWATEVYHGRQAPVPATIEDPGCRVLAAWLAQRDSSDTVPAHSEGEVEGVKGKVEGVSP
jgi:hypothetical protein